MAGPRLFVTDLDNTLVGDADGLRELLELLDRQEGLLLVYATGRSYASVLQLIEELELPIPHALAAQVGTQLYHLRPVGTSGRQRRRGEGAERGGAPRGAGVRTSASRRLSSRLEPHTPDRRWAKHISWRWDAAAVDAIALEQLRLERQPDWEQGPFKRAFFVGRSDFEAVARAFSERLEAVDLSANLIWHSYRNVDIVPSRASKGAVTRYLMDRYGVCGERTLICGDSGNDAAMLLLDCRCVAVGNSSPELIELIERDGRHVYRARGQAARGILEGIEALRFFGDDQEEDHADLP